MHKKIDFAQKLQSLHKNYKGLLRPAGRVRTMQASERRFLLRRVGPGCLFWIVLSVVLSVTLTILLNALLYLL